MTVGLTPTKYDANYRDDLKHERLSGGDSHRRNAGDGSIAGVDKLGQTPLIFSFPLM